MLFNLPPTSLPPTSSPVSELRMLVFSAFTLLEHWKLVVNFSSTTAENDKKIIVIVEFFIIPEGGAGKLGLVVDVDILLCNVKLRLNF